MAQLITNIGCLVTVDSAGKGALPGARMQNLGVRTNAAVLFDDTILWIGDAPLDKPTTLHGHTVSEIIDADGLTVMPGFVDSHTHVVFAGSRATEFARRLAGTSYQTIAQEGGGILTTMNATRSASVSELAEQALDLIVSARDHGTTTMEIKSGYGLTLEAELRQLQAISIAQDEVDVKLVSTFLGAHDIPPEYSGNAQGYVEHIIADMLPRVVEQGIAGFIDVFCDTGYFTPEQAEQILRAGKAVGLTPKIHADELSAYTAAEVGARVGAVSADHLLFISDDGIRALKESDTVATLLPGTAYTLRLPYAPARKLIDNGNIVALATDANPGSCFCENMQTILSLACTNMNMSIEEAIVAATLHGAYALGLQDQVGSIEVGKSADFVLYDVDNYADIVYHFGANHVVAVWINGEQSE